MRPLVTIYLRRTRFILLPETNENVSKILDIIVALTLSPRNKVFKICEIFMQHSCDDSHSTASKDFGYSSKRKTWGRVQKTQN